VRGVPTPPPGCTTEDCVRPSEPVPGWAKHRGSVNETFATTKSETCCYESYRYDASSRRRAYVTPSESHERGEGDATGPPRVRDQWEGFSAPGDARGVPDANESARTSAWKQTKSENITFRQSTRAITTGRPFPQLDGGTPSRRTCRRFPSI